MKKEKNGGISVIRSSVPIKGVISGSVMKTHKAKIKAAAIITS